MSVGLLVLVTWILRAIAALGAVLFGCAKYIDWRRQKKVPIELTSRVYTASVHQQPGDVYAATRPAPIFAGKRNERVARFEEAASAMKTGDGLTFSGRTIWGYILRIGTFSDKSHAGMVIKDDEGIWVVDACEGRNVTKRRLFDEVRKFPGQWYWSAIRPDVSQNYHRLRAAAAAHAMIANRTTYGWVGIILQAMIRSPFLRELAYLLQLDQLPFYKSRPFCSHALKDWMHAGSLDPVPRRAGQLVTPQDINQSMAFREWIALVP